MNWILRIFWRLIPSGWHLQHAISAYISVLIALTLYYVIARILKKKHNVGHVLITYVFAFYLVGIVTMTGIGDREGFSPNIVLVPFRDMIRGPIDTIQNVFLFIPLGIFLPLIYNKFDRGEKVLLAGFCISLSVEIIQMFACGTTDINDLITNTAGACVGYKVICKIMPEKWRKVFWIEGKECFIEFALLWAGIVVLARWLQPACLTFSQTMN